MVFYGMGKKNVLLIVCVQWMLHIVHIYMSNNAMLCELMATCYCLTV
jgi:hypothetical protein